VGKARSLCNACRCLFEQQTLTTLGLHDDKDVARVGTLQNHGPPTTLATALPVRQHEEAGGECIKRNRAEHIRDELRQRSQAAPFNFHL